MGAVPACENAIDVFDAVIDFDKIVHDSSAVSQLDSKFNSGDYLNLNVAGYQAIADAFPLTISK
jgi:hypothetical protein